MATLAELKVELADLDVTISEARKTAKEYAVVGSHSVKNYDLKDLREERALLVKRMVRFQGYIPENKPDFGDV